MTQIKLMKTILTVCETCHRIGNGAGLKRDGDTFAEIIESTANKVEEVEVRRFQCLAGCDFACNLTIQENGKFTYLFGSFEPTELNAKAIVKFAQLYHQSEDGIVPWKSRPEALKGHMRGKIPILD